MLRRDEQGRSEQRAAGPFRAVGRVDFERGGVGFFEREGDAGAPGALGVGGVAEEGLGWGGEEGGFCVGEG